MDHRCHHRPGRLDEMGPYLLEQFPALLCREGLTQVLFCRSQYTQKADQEQISDQVGANALGTSAHVILLETADPVADGGFDFSLSLHGAHPCRAMSSPGRAVA